jgi:hypothetical protein
VIAPSAVLSGAQINGREQTTIQHERSEYVARSRQPVEIWKVEHRSKAETEVGRTHALLASARPESDQRVALPLARWPRWRPSSSTTCLNARPASAGRPASPQCSDFGPIEDNALTTRAFAGPTDNASTHLVAPHATRRAPVRIASIYSLNHVLF